jgi:iron complex transport system substrate-binding protein
VGVVDTIQKKTDFFPDLKSRQSIGKWNDINYEMLGEIAKKGDSIPPDILVISYTYPDKPYGVAAVEKGLAPFKGINVVGLDFYKPETVEEEITKLGAILGKEDKAREYLDWRNQKLSQVEDAVDGLVMPKVYFEMNSKGGLGALSTYGKGSGLNDLQRKAGGYNIAKDLEESSPKVDWE